MIGTVKDDRSPSDNPTARVVPPRKAEASVRWTSCDGSEPEDLVPCLRLHMPGGLDKKYLESDPEVIVENYEGLISDLLVRTTRPTKCVLAAAAQKAWLNVKQTEGNMWAERIAKAVSHCYNKRLQSSTGVRLKPSVRRVMATINKYCTLQAERKPVKEKSKRSLKKVESAAPMAFWSRSRDRVAGPKLSRSATTHIGVRRGRTKEERGKPGRICGRMTSCQTIFRAPCAVAGLIGPEVQLSGRDRDAGQNSRPGG